MTHPDKLMQCAAPVVVARYMDRSNARSLYVLVISLLAVMVSLKVAWYFIASS